MASERAIKFCHECRAQAGDLHNPECPANLEQGADVVKVDELREDRAEDPVNIPLDVQERLFTFAREQAIYDLRDLLERFAWTQSADWEDDAAGQRNELHDLARARLRSGFVLYGSAMFTWTPEERFRNVMEELADAIVYLTSGPVE